MMSVGNPCQAMVMTRVIVLRWKVVVDRSDVVAEAVANRMEHCARKRHRSDV